MPPSSNTSKNKKRDADAAPKDVSAPTPADDKYAATQWGSSVEGQIELTVPSGQLCLVRRPGVEGLLKAGVLHNIDSLTALVNEKHVTRVKGKKGKDKGAEIDIMSLMKDQKGLENVLHTVDRVVCHTVIKPHVEMTPNDVTRRKDGVVYTDMIDLMDKMFIFQFVVGGTRDLESFRGEFGTAVGDMADLPGLGGASE